MIEPEFTAALNAMGLELDEPLAARMQAYAQTMWRFNESINLTRHTTWDLFVSRDLRDCLQLAMLLQPGEEILDLGSGNGVPGIPLSILRPDVEVSLAESVGKRAKVLDELVTELQLPVAVYAARGEDLLEDFRFTTIVSRAVGSLAKFCRWMQPHWGQVDRLLLVKGPRWVDERGEARHLGMMKDIDLRVVATYPLGPVIPPPDDVDSEADIDPEADIASEADIDSESDIDPEGEPENADDARFADGSSGGDGVILQLNHKSRRVE